MSKIRFQESNAKGSLGSISQEAYQESDWDQFLTEQVLSYHPPDVEDGPMTRNEWLDWWQMNRGYFYGPLIFFLGLGLAIYVEPHFQWRILDELIVALLIAGILATTIDPFVKSRAMKEASKDIFQHMLGFSLPLIIRERLVRTIADTKLYRKGVRQFVEMSEVGNSVVFDIRMDFDVVNPTPHDRDWEPHLQFQRGEQAVLKGVTCFERPDYARDAKLSPSKDGLGSEEYKAPRIRIPGNEGKLHFKYEYSVTYPTASGFFFPNFSLPTIGFHITLKSPPNFAVEMTKDKFGIPGESRHEDKLWMSGEHFEIVWEKL